MCQQLVQQLGGPTFVLGSERRLRTPLGTTPRIHYLPEIYPQRESLLGLKKTRRNFCNAVQRTPNSDHPEKKQIPKMFLASGGPSTTQLHTRLSCQSTHLSHTHFNPGTLTARTASPSSLPDTPEPCEK